MKKNYINKILAIDDHWDNLLIYEAIINENIPECKLITATSATKGIELALKEKPDVILLDIIMPEMDGFEACSKIKNIEKLKYIPVIMITAIKTDSANRVKALNIGADAFISKPIDPIELVAQIKVMLRIKNAEDEILKEKQLLHQKYTTTSLELQKSRESYKTVYHITNDGIIHLDNNFIVKSVNKAFCEITGISEKNILNKSSRELASKQLKDTSTHRIIELIKASLEEGLSKSIELEYNSRILQISYFTNSTDDIIGILRDVTALRKSIDALKKSEMYFKTIIENITDVISIIDNQELIVYASPSYKTILGYETEELINKNAFANLHPDDKNMMSQRIKDFKNKPGETIPFHCRFHHKNGNCLFVEGTAKNLINSEYINGIVLNFRDVTEQYLARNELLENQTVINAILESTGEGIVVLNNTGEITHYNNEFLKILNIQDPNSASKQKDVINKINSIDNLIDQNSELRNSDKNTKDIYNYTHGRIFERQSKPLILKGKISGRVWCFNDITENKKTELVKNILYNISNAANISNNLFDHISFIQKELGKIIDTQNMYVALYNSDNNTLSFPFYSDEKDNFKIVSADKTLTHYVISTNKPLLANLDTKKRFVKEGKLKHIGSLSKVWIGAPLTNNKTPFGVLALQSYNNEFAFDEYDMKLLEFVSSQISVSILKKTAENKLKDALIHAEESDKLKSAFLANMSHEIRTPMNGILGFAGLLKKKNLTSNQLNKYIGIIEKSGARMINIINNLVDISKIEAGQMNKTIADCNVNEQLDFLHNFFNREAQNKGLTLKLNTDNKLENLILRTDCEKLYAILANLIKNAIKYTPIGHVEFGYYLKEKQINFYVSDTGIGIPKERQNAIYDRFVQADIEDKNALEGAGLGLSITKAYAEMLNANIQLISDENEGTTFTVSFPFDKSKKIIDSKKQNSETIDKKTTSNCANILIVEDEYFVSEYIKVILKAINCNIFIATNGLEAIHMFKNNHIDLILLDIKIPLMDGFEVTREIRKLNKDVIIIAQTAFILNGYEDKALDAGCNSYITKPIYKDELLDTIQKHIGNKFNLKKTN